MGVFRGVFWISTAKNVVFLMVCGWFFVVKTWLFAPRFPASKNMSLF
jgi:hypothetical protein